MGSVCRLNADARSRVLTVFGVALSSLLLSWTAVAQPAQPKGPLTLQAPPQAVSPSPGRSGLSVAQELQPRLVDFRVVSARSDDLAATERAASAIVVLGGMESARDVAIRLEGCGWSANLRISRSRPNAVNGEVRDTIPGVLEFSGCSMDVHFNYALPPNFQTRSRQFTLRTQPVVAMPRKTVRLTTFDQINRLVRFSESGGNIGACSGFSDFGAGRFAVGVAPGSQGRFTFAVRSGPIGTYCRWKSALVTLPAGVVLTKIDTTAQSDNSTGPNGRGATCRVHDTFEDNPDTIVNGFDVFTVGTAWLHVGNYDWGAGDDPNLRGYQPLVYHAVRYRETETGSPDYHSWLVPIRVGMECGISALNDHYATLTINEMTFSVPEDVSFP